MKHRKYKHLDRFLIEERPVGYYGTQDPLRQLAEIIIIDEKNGKRVGFCFTNGNPNRDKLDEVRDGLVGFLLY